MKGIYIIAICGAKWYDLLINYWEIFLVWGSDGVLDSSVKTGMQLHLLG
ncbi:MAG: hypothetical protein ACREV6_15960 [Clostridium sp.]